MEINREMCNTCSHMEICKNKEKYDEVYSKVLNLLCDDFEINLILKCPHYSQIQTTRTASWNHEY